MGSSLVQIDGGMVVPTRPNRPARKIIRAVASQESIELAKVEALAAVGRAAMDHTAFLAFQRQAYTSHLPGSEDLLGLVAQGVAIQMAERVARANQRLG